MHTAHHPCRRRCVHQIAQMSAKGNRVAQVVMPVHQLPEQKTLLVTPHHFQHHRLNLAQLPLQPLRLPRSVCGIRRVPTGLPGRLSGSSRRPSPSSRSRNSRHSRAFNFPVGLFQSSNSHTVRASSIRLRPPQLSTNSWIKLSSDELNRLPLKFAPLVPISLLATTTVANAGTNVQQKVTPLRVHNQSKFRYPLTNLTTSDRWTVRSLRKWAILAVPKEPHPSQIHATFGNARRIPPASTNSWWHLHPWIPRSAWVE